MLRLKMLCTGFDSAHGPAMSKRFDIFIFAFLLICLSAVLTCALLPQGVVFAADTKEDIEIKAEVDGDDVVWSMSGAGDGLTWDYRGDFVSDDAITSLKQTLARWLWNSGKIGYDKFESFYATGEWNCHDYFDVAFDFPAIDNVKNRGITETEYTLSQSQIVIGAEFKSIVALSPLVHLEYNKVGSPERHKTAESTDTNVVFGNGVDVGQYDVTYVVAEAFSFDGKYYKVERRATSPITCTVKKADLQMSAGDVVIPYGTRASDIGQYIFKSIETSSVADITNGTFELSEEQTDDVFEGISDIRDILINVDSATHRLKFDYTHASGNFNTLKNISVNVKVQPKELVVKISDIYSLVGDELLSLDGVGYYIDGTLIGDDTIDDLGVQLHCSPDNTKVAWYLITATFTNANYTPVNKSQTSPFIDGGRYMVFAKSITVATEDGEAFAVYFEDGFVSIKNVIISVISAYSPFDDKEIVRAYKIVLADNDYNPVEVQGSYYVSWSSGMSGAQWVSVGQGDIVAIGSVGNSVALDNDNNEIYFYVDVVTETTSTVWTWQNILLLVISCVLIVGIIVLAIVWNKGRRYLK